MGFIASVVLFILFIIFLIIIIPYSFQIAFYNLVKKLVLKKPMTFKEQVKKIENDEKDQIIIEIKNPKIKTIVKINGARYDTSRPINYDNFRIIFTKD